MLSSRLHVLLPCLAFETPVLRIVSGKYERDIEGRFSGYEDFVHTAQLEEFLQNKDVYDFDNPPKNPDNYLKLREDLIRACSEFTGCNREESLLPEERYPELRMYELSKATPKKLRRILMFMKPTRMLRMFFYKKFLGKDHCDIDDDVVNVDRILPPKDTMM